MCSKFIVVIFILFSSLFSHAQFYNGETSTEGGAVDQSYQNALTDSFTEFSAAYVSFINQNRKLIASGQYKQARELLTPFIDQFRARLGFKSKSHVLIQLKNISADDATIVHKELIGSSEKNHGLASLSPDLREKLFGSIDKALATRYMESLMSYKRVLLLYLTAVFGEQNSYSGNDKQNFSRNFFDDFLFLLAPAIRFEIPDSPRYLVIYEFELNPTTEQTVFDADLSDFVLQFAAYFSFLRTPQNTVSIEQDFKRFKFFQQDVVRRTLAIKDGRRPANAPNEGSATASPNEPSDLPTPEEKQALKAQSTDPAEEAERLIPVLPASPPRHHFNRPTAIVSQNAKGVLQFDLNSLSELADADGSVEALAQDLKVYLTSSAMTWGQNQIQYTSAFTHSNSQIKVYIKSFPLNPKFISALIEVYYSELFTFELFAKEALSKSNTLDKRNMVYNCLVRMSLAPIAVNCDSLLAETSMYDEIGRKKLADAYARLLRLSRMTFEFSSDELLALPQSATTCERILEVQSKMLNSYKSTVNSYLPSLINIQGPSFKNASTGKREFLCKGSLNPFLQ